MVEAAGVKPKALYQPIRVALTGSTVSPGIFESLAALGRDGFARPDRRRIWRAWAQARPERAAYAT